MAAPSSGVEPCGLCGAKTVCRMELAGRMRTLCPECLPIVVSEDAQGALARTLIAGPENQRVH